MSKRVWIRLGLLAAGVFLRFFLYLREGPERREVVTTIICLKEDTELLIRIFASRNHYTAVLSDLTSGPSGGSS